MCFSLHIAVSIGLIKNSLQEPFNLEHGDKLASKINHVDSFAINSLQLN